jgi:hypothetical protein
MEAWDGADMGNRLRKCSYTRDLMNQTRIHDYLLDSVEPPLLLYRYVVDVLQLQRKCVNHACIYLCEIFESRLPLPYILPVEVAVKGYYDAIVPSLMSFIEEHFGIVAHVLKENRLVILSTHRAIVAIITTIILLVRLVRLYQWLQSLKLTRLFHAFWAGIKYFPFALWVEIYEAGHSITDEHVEPYWNSFVQTIKGADRGETPRKTRVNKHTLGAVEPAPQPQIGKGKSKQGTVESTAQLQAGKWKSKKAKSMGKTSGKEIKDKH